jgi:hypothetical protein
MSMASAVEESSLGKTTRRVNISSAPAVALLTSGDPVDSGGAEKGVS